MQRNAFVYVNEKQVKRRRKRIIRRIRLAVIVLIALTVGIIFALVPYRGMLPAIRIEARAEGAMRLHFMSIGQGDCTIVEFPEGDILVVDGGDGSFNHTNLLVRYIKGLAPASISFAATHADGDHIGGIAELIRLFDADTLYLPAVEGHSTEYKEMITAAQKAGVKLEKLVRYDGFSRPSGAYMVCISPYSMGETDKNDASSVFYLSYHGVNTLLTGDVSDSRERRLAAEYSADSAIFDSPYGKVALDDIDILKVSHHGSAYASSEEFLSLIEPDVEVISCGAGNIYSHPTEEAVARLSAHGKIYRTDELGTIVVEIGAGGYRVNYR